MSTLVVATLLGLWMLFSIAVLHPRWRLYIRAWDIFAVVPEWKFFAPNPAQGDFHLLYRDHLSEGTVTPWTEIHIGATRSWCCVLWNPRRRQTKALFDAVSHLNATAQAAPQTVVGSLPYLTLLLYISSMPRLINPAFTQFLVVHSFGIFSDTEPAIVFLSELHSL